MQTNELDDLKSAWQTLNRNPELQHALARRLFNENTMTRFRAGLRPLASGQIIQLVCGAILAGWSANFWTKHFGQPHLLIYGISLHAYGLMLLAFAVRDLVLIGRIDYSAPVIALQKQVAALRAWHIRAGLWFAAVGCFIWMPLILVILYLLGADVWDNKPQVIIWFLSNSVVCFGLVCAVVRWARQPGQSKFARYLHDSWIGRAVNRAQRVLDEIERFERE